LNANAKTRIHKSPQRNGALRVTGAIMIRRTDAAIRAAKDAIASALSQTKQDADEAKQRGRRLREQRYTVIQPTLVRLAMLTESIPDENKTLRVSSYFSRPCITVSLRNQTSLKSDVINAVLEYAMGITSKAWSHDYATQHCSNREHTFYGDNVEIKVSIDIAESGTCRKVLKGQKTTVVDEYEFVCEE
jgi:hypothetical protein